MEVCKVSRDLTKITIKTNRYITLTAVEVIMHLSNYRSYNSRKCNVWISGCVVVGGYAYHKHSYTRVGSDNIFRWLLNLNFYSSQSSKSHLIYVYTHFKFVVSTDLFSRINSVTFRDSLEHSAVLIARRIIEYPCVHFIDAYHVINIKEVCVCVRVVCVERVIESNLLIRV